jgi:hypothetical protein
MACEDLLKELEKAERDADRAERDMKQAEKDIRDAENHYDWALFGMFACLASFEVPFLLALCEAAAAEAAAEALDDIEDAKKEYSNAFDDWQDSLDDEADAREAYCACMNAAGK